MPGAMNAAVNGDLGPLLRLKKIGQGPVSRARDFSWGLTVTTDCLDSQLPYSLGSDPLTRPALLQSALAAIPPSAYAPWSTETVRTTSSADDCLQWPRDDRPRPSIGGLPDVPALLLSGRLDMRTPLEDAQRVKALMPRAQLVTVPGNGHDEVDSDGTGCVAKALTRFTARKPVGQPCKGTSNLVLPIPRAPRTLSDVTAPSSVPGDRGRTLLAALHSVEDARFSALEAVYGGFSPRGGGLRGGSFDATDAFRGAADAARLQLRPGRSRLGHAAGRRQARRRDRARRRRHRRHAEAALDEGRFGDARRAAGRVRRRQGRACRLRQRATTGRSRRSRRRC